MKNPSGYAVALLFFLLALAACSRKTDPSKAVARIDGAAITYRDYESALKELLYGEDIAPEELTALKRSLINELIEERLILREAERLGLAISEDELSDEIKAMGQNPEDPKFKSAIAERYSSLEDWKKAVRNRLLAKKTVRAVIDPAIEVTEKEARGYYEKNKSLYGVAERVRARMIVVESEEKAREAKRSLEKERFEDVARRVSTGPEAQEGGDLGFFSRGEMPPEFDVVFTLPAGKTSPIVKTPYGYHIFKVEGRKKERTLAFKDVKDEIMETLFEEKTEKNYRDWLLSLKKNAKIEVSEELL